VTLAVALLAVAAFLVSAKVASGSGQGNAAGPGGAGTPGPSGSAGGSPSPSGSASGGGPVSADGSVTSPPTAQPPFPVTKLAPGQKPPQFVIVAFDGAGDVDQLRQWAQITQEMQSHVTYFLSGVFMLNPANRMYYQPPQHTRGYSAIGFAKPQNPIPTVTSLLSQAYLDGNDIGTHFNGHFCGANGVNDWSTADWTSELKQFDNFVNHWRSYNQIDGQPTAYDSSVVVGARTPCLEGRKAAYLPALAAAGYRYDTSATGELVWPTKTTGGMWEFPLQTIRWIGPGGGSMLAMDYNLWYRYNKAKPITTDPQRQLVSNAVLNSYLAAFNATYTGNRAPLFFGNHMNYWGCDTRYTDCDHTGTLANPTQLQHFGPFVDGLMRFYVNVCAKPDVQCISYKDMADWLDGQDPAVVAHLQGLPAVS
jgi:hypothetical protein